MTAKSEIVIAGAGYAGLHIALRLASKLKADDANLTLIDKYDYHQFLTELPRVAAGTRPADDVRVPLETVLDDRVTFVHSAITGFDFEAKQVQTAAEAVPYTTLILALGSRPNDFGIPGVRDNSLSLWSVDDAKKILAEIDKCIADAGVETDAEARKRLLTVAIGGAGATGVELAGELAEVLPELMQRHDMANEKCRIVLIEATPTVMPGTSAGLQQKADRTLRELDVEIRTESPIGEATAEGFVLKSGEVVRAGVRVWTAGVKAPDLVSKSGLPTGPGGRIVVDEFLRVEGRPEIYVAGDCALVQNPEVGRPLPPTAQIAIEEGETVAANVIADATGGKAETFHFKNKGYVISVGGRSGVADVAGLTIAGRPAMMLKNAIEWEYRQSVKHLNGWSPIHSV
ncbi:MAG TPA: NAD(P)/FAD-dependent oxidoreductase [Abditibacteriaceae bacterium]|jgi:NADH dehydrogenase